MRETRTTSTELVWISASLTWLSMLMGSTFRLLVFAAIERLVLIEAGRLIVCGIVIGAGLALAGRRVLEGMLFGIRSTDPVTYLGMCGLLALVAFLACQLPAIRAARVDPLRALRAE